MFERSRLLALTVALFGLGCGSIDSETPEPIPTRDPAAPTAVAPAHESPSQTPNQSPTPPRGLADAPGQVLPYCPGRGTTLLRFHANLDANSQVPALAWDIVDPANTSNFSTTIAAYTADGNPQTLDVYFVKYGDSAWEYHVLGGANVELGSGKLAFEGGALLSHRVVAKAMLVGAHGFEPLTIWFGTPLDRGGSGLDGVVEIPGSSNVTFQDQNGLAANVGSACPNGEVVPARPSRPANASDRALLERVGMCAAEASRRLRVRANLAAQAPIVTVPWEPSNPTYTSNFSAGFWVTDGAGRTARFGLYFSKVDERTWVYHVLLLVNDRPGPERASGALRFEENGALGSVSPTSPFYFPNADGSDGERIELELGAPGVDGLTSFATRSSLFEIETDGHGIAFGAACESSGSALSFDPRLGAPAFGGHGPWQENPCGARSSYLGLSGFLNPGDEIDARTWDIDAPASPKEIRLSKRLFDAYGMPVEVEARLRRVAENRWEVHLADVDARYELANFRVLFDGSSNYQAQIEGAKLFRFPLTDSTPGPAVHITTSLWQSPIGTVDALHSDGAPSSCAAH